MIQVNEKLLIIHMDAGKSEKIRRIAGDMKITCVMVGEDEEHVPLGLLAGADNWRNPLLMQNMKEDVPITEEMLVICGLSDRRLDQLLSRMKIMQVRVSLKAVLTEQNALWSPSQLCGELKGERDAFLAASPKARTPLQR